jgi:glycosyltransferase involved in cell wall biosynthesis
MRILMLTSDAHGTLGGISQYNIDLLEAMNALDSVASVEVCPVNVRWPVGTLPAKVSYDLKGTRGKFAYLLRALWRAMAGPPCDLVWCGHINLLGPAWLVAKLRRAPLVLAVYGIDAWQPTKRPVADWLASRADLVVSISEVTLERFRSWSPVPADRVAILPNAITLADYGIGPRSEDLVKKFDLEGRRVLMTFGRLVGRDRAKGFDEVLDLLPRLVERYPDLVYIIAGTGPDAERLKDRARALGVAGHVRFTGYVPEETKADYFRLADAYIMPSRGEGFGFVILEAMACGVPAVASTVDGGFEAVLKGRLGNAVDPDDAVALEAAIIDALAQPKAIPAGLDHFEHRAFTTRLGEALVRVGAPSAGADA